MVKVQTAVINTVQSALVSVVLSADTGKEASVLVTDWHIEAVDSVVDSLGNELSEDHCSFSVQCCITQVVLPCSAEGCIDNPFPCCLIEGGGGGNGGHIGAVPGLGHGIDTWGLQRHCRGQETIVVFFGSQVSNCGSKQSPLHTRLNLERRVSGYQLLESCQVSAVIIEPAIGGRESPVDLSVFHQKFELSKHASAVLVHTKAWDVVHLWLTGECTGSEANICPFAQQIAR